MCGCGGDFLILEPGSSSWAAPNCKWLDGKVSTQQSIAFCILNPHLHPHPHPTLYGHTCRMNSGGEKTRMHARHSHCHTLVQNRGQRIVLEMGKEMKQRKFRYVGKSLELPTSKWRQNL
jgi:hypothetical protein